MPATLFQSRIVTVWTSENRPVLPLPQLMLPCLHWWEAPCRLYVPVHYAGWMLILFAYSAGLFVPLLSPLSWWSLSLQYSYTAPQLEFNAVVFVQRGQNLRVDSAADLHGRGATPPQQKDSRWELRAGRDLRNPWMRLFASVVVLSQGN